MMTSKITIIVPVYKTEKYLDRCIRSILGGVFTDIEVLLVDDGSPDGFVCDEYAKKDSRVRVIRHNKNKGLSAARNEGLRQAQAAYIGFVDSDDWIHPSMYDDLYQLSMKYNADIVTCGMSEQTVYLAMTPYDKSTPEITIMDGMDALKKSLVSEPTASHTAWGKLYKRDLFEGVEYPEKRVYEDAATTYRLYYRTKRVVHTSAQYYFYYIHSGSISNSGFNPRSMDKMTAADEIIDFANENNPDLLPYAECFKTVTALRLAASMSSDDKKKHMVEHKKIDQILLNPYYRKNRMLSKRHKFLMKLYKYCKPAFNAVWRKRLK